VDEVVEDKLFVWESGADCDAIALARINEGRVEHVSRY
jgi:hypothetical protein